MNRWEPIGGATVRQDPLLAVFAALGEEIVRIRDLAESWRASSEHATAVASQAYREGDAKTTKIQELEGRVAIARRRDAALTEFVRGLAGDNGKPIRSKAQSAARDLLNDIGWSAR